MESCSRSLTHPVAPFCTCPCEQRETEQGFIAVVVVDRFYIALFSARAESLRSHVILHERLVLQCYSALFEYPPKRCTYSTAIIIIIIDRFYIALFSAFEQTRCARM